MIRIERLIHRHDTIHLARDIGAGLIANDDSARLVYGARAAPLGRVTTLDSKNWLSTALNNGAIAHIGLLARFTSTDSPMSIDPSRAFSGLIQSSLVISALKFRQFPSPG